MSCRWREVLPMCLLYHCQRLPPKYHKRGLQQTGEKNEQDRLVLLIFFSGLFFSGIEERERAYGILKARENPALMGCSVWRHAICHQPLHQLFGLLPYPLRRCRAGARCMRPGCHWRLPQWITCLAGTSRWWVHWSRRRRAGARLLRSHHYTLSSVAYRWYGSRASCPGHW